ncbi:uncharacterized protein RSE6_08793 [Rhynchosporium secalis]|uniref:DUF7707 domain-containing protein n=1 Tax=Rhynchosporium secalis TaxID=38038 RepID=A0A1E1MGC0_RHYSE|nr:uncharacterized protein RSE6_08793 [Rhynchosporium secalis]
MFVKSVAAVAVFASFVAAQSNATVDPNTISPTMRSQWCLAQKNTCGTLCSGNLADNDCDATTLAYKCNCGSNSSAPGLQYYTNTMPTFICEEVFRVCKKANEGVAAAQKACETNEQQNCGHNDPAKFVAAAVSTSASAPSSNPTGTNSPASGTSAPSSSSKAAAATMMPASFGWPRILDYGWIARTGFA